MNEVKHFRPSRLEAPYPWIGHTPFVVWLMRVHQPRTVVELGVHTGNSFFAMCEVALLDDMDTTVHGLDTWEGDVHAGIYNEDVWLSVSGFVNQRYSKKAQLHRGLFDDNLSHFKDGTIDLLHIDGLHTYEAVKHDFETWLPKLSERAIVMFHDTEERRDDFGVYRLWAEITEKYPTLSFKHSHGLGVAFVGTHAQALGKAIATPIDNAMGQRTQLESHFENSAFDLMNHYVHSGRLTDPRQHQVKFTFGFFPVTNNASRVVAEKFTHVELNSGLVPHELSLEIPDLGSPEIVDAIRIDPSTAAGLVSLDSLCLTSPNGDTLHQFDLKNALFNQSAILTGMSGHSLLISCLTEDPQFFVRIPAKLLPLALGTRLTFKVCAFPENSVATASTAALLTADNLLDSVSSHAQKQISASQQLMDQLGVQLNAQMSAQLSAHLSAQMSDYRGLLQTESVAREQRHTSTEKALLVIQEQYKTLSERVEQSNQGLIESNRALETEQSQSRQYHDELTTLKDTLAKITQSRVWRWTAIFRR
jgi:Methyltransferase domain